MTNSFDRLDSFLKLEEGWDTYGSYKIDKRAVDSAKLFLEHAPVVPINDGGIQIEWHYPEFDLEIEFHPNGKIRSVYLKSDGKIKQKFLELEFDE